MKSICRIVCLLAGACSVLALSLRAEATKNLSEVRVAAATFEVTGQIGQPAAFSATGQNIQHVIGGLKTTIILFESGSSVMCLLSSPFPIEAQAPLRNSTKALIAHELGIEPAQIVNSSSHDHSLPFMRIEKPELWGRGGEFPVGAANEIGLAYMKGLRDAARTLRARLTPVTISWGVAKETRVTYNRRGHRPDGRSYFIREEDRLLLGADYVGNIDPDAPVVILRDRNEKPVAALALFTGHPVTAYNPETPIAFGEWPQVACEKLSAHLGGVPVAFFQGCAGDVNSKYMLTGTPEQATQLGEYLGESFIKAADSARSSERTDFEWTRTTVQIPYAPLPEVASLEQDLKEIDGFIHRAEAGDQDTYYCVGLNFPKALSPLYRARLMDPVRRWYVWALEQHRAGKIDALPKSLPQEIVVARLGDVGLVGLKFEAFVRTGMKIKQEAPLPLVLTACYTDGGEGYIPDATACDDREYQAGFFRYMGDRPPYAAPGGDAAASGAVAALKKFVR